MDPAARRSRQAAAVTVVEAVGEATGRRRRTAHTFHMDTGFTQTRAHHHGHIPDWHDFDAEYELHGAPVIEAILSRRRIVDPAHNGIVVPVGDTAVEKRAAIRKMSPGPR